jgi:hypothetical protein
MKRYQLFFAFALLLLFFALESTVFAQNEPVMYFCDKFDSNGAVGISDRRTVGNVTIVVKSNYAMGLSDITIQFDKYDCRKSEFEYHDKFYYSVEPEMKIIFLEKDEENDMKFRELGIYRVFLLDDKDRTIASALIEITE